MDSEDLERLLRAGDPDGPRDDEACGLLAQLRRSPEEGRAIDLLLARDRRSALPEPLLVAVASALADRGDEATAARALARATSTPALMLRADLLARARDVPGAVALVERVLLRDIDWPGARERHARWRAALGELIERPRRPDASETLVTGAPDAPFRLVREVGRGGAGAVYEAEDRELGRRVALKVYHHPDRDRAQLLHEARVAVALAGDGIVRVFDVDPGHGWIAMEHAPLGALRARLLEAAAPSIAAYAEPLARALARVHAAGWVHHDVKPANVLLRRPDAPLLSDFGTARRFGEPSPPGSLGYVSPERLAGRASDPRDDTYGFGRVVEDALHASGDEADASAWMPIVAACTGPDEGRPSDAELLERIQRRQGKARS
jgi:serine/threonine-protein kinase